MKIQLWSDFACPFCYIGEERLSQVIQEMGLTDAIDVEMMSFQLDENASAHPDKTIHELIAQKYGTSVEKAKASNDNIVSMAKEIGLDFDFDAIKVNNTALAHSLLKYAEAHGKGKEITQKLFKAYFEEGYDIGVQSNLIELARQVGLNVEEVLINLKNGAYLDAVKADQQTAYDLGITSVPFFIIDGKYSISGAQSKAYFKMAIEKILEMKDQAV